MDGHVEVQPGESTRADVVLRTDPETLNALLNEPHTLDAALSEATIVVEGNLSALRELLAAGAIPTPA